jgi:TrmH family RNA methyltransferase
MADAHDSAHCQLSIDATLAEVHNLQDRHHRDAHGLFYAEGVRNFVQLADNGFDFVTILYSERLLTAPLARKLVRRLRRRGIPTIGLSPEQFRKVSRTKRASGVSAIVRQRWARIHGVRPKSGLCWIVLGQVRSLGNFGTLIRTSEAVGGAGFILLENSVDLYSPVALRASMGALFRQQFVRTSTRSLRHWIRRHRLHVIGASPDGAVDFHQLSFPRSALLFLGEERMGLTYEQREMCHQLVRIPMVGAADSLNLGVAGSLLMYEVYRSNQ